MVCISLAVVLRAVTLYDVTIVKGDGDVETPFGVLPAIVNLLRNAFIAGFAHSLEGSIDFRDVGEAGTCVGPDDGHVGRRTAHAEAILPP